MPTDAELLAILETRHDDCRGPFGARWWKLARDAYDGSGGFLANLGTAMRGTRGEGSYESSGDVPSRDSYLIPYPREDDRYLAARQRLAVYENYTRPFVDTYGGFLFRKGPDRTTESKAVRAFWDRPDDSGADWTDLVRKAVKRCQLFPFAAALVDRPQSVDGAPLPIGAAPTIARVLQPEELADWQLDASGNFVWARLVTETCERDPLDPSIDLDRTTHTIWTRTTWTRIDVEERDGEQERIVARTEGTHPCGRVPIVILRWQESLQPEALYGVPQVSGIVAANVDLFNVTSELREHLRAAVFAVLTINADKDEEVANVNVGTSRGLRYPKGASPPGFITAPPEVAITLENRRQGIIAELYRAAMLEQPKGSAMGGAAAVASGVARAYDFALTDRILGDFARCLTSWEYDVAALVAAWAGETDIASTAIRWPETFDIASLQQELETQFSVLNAAFDKQTGTRVLPPIVEKLARERIMRALHPMATESEAADFAAQNETLYGIETRALAASAEGDVKPTKELTEYALPAVTIDEVRGQLGLPPLGGTDGSANAYEVKLSIEARAQAAGAKPLPTAPPPPAP